MASPSVQAQHWTTNSASLHLRVKANIKSSNLSFFSSDCPVIILAIPGPGQQSTDPPAPAPHHGFADNQSQKTWGSWRSRTSVKATPGLPLPSSQIGRTPTANAQLMHVYFNSCVNNTRNNTRKKLTYARKKGKGFLEEAHICPCMSKVERDRLVMTSTTTTTPWGYDAQMSCCYRSQEKMKPQHDAIKFEEISCLTEGGDYLQVVYVFNNVIWSYVSVRQPVGTNENRLTGTVLRNSNTSNWKQLTEPVPLTPQGTCCHHLDPEEEVFVFLISVFWLSLQIHIFNAAKKYRRPALFFFSEASPKSKETKIQIKHKNSGNK